MAFTQPRMTAPHSASINKTLDIANITTQTTLETTVPWPGVDQNSIVFCRCDSLTSGLVIQNPCPTTAGNVTLRIANVKTTDVDPASNLVFNFIRF